MSRRNGHEVAGLEDFRTATGDQNEATYLRWQAVRDEARWRLHQAQPRLLTKQMQPVQRAAVVGIIPRPADFPPLAFHE